MLSALGFSAAYFLDFENVAARRKRVHDFVRRTAVDLDEALTPEFGSLRSIRTEPVINSQQPDYVSSNGVKLVTPW